MNETVPLHEHSPKWFWRALAVPFTESRVEVDGAAIHYLAWGEEGRRGLVFVHGGGAHAHWWTHVAARFADEFRVLAVDLSGHGDSDHRDVYAMEQWTEEVIAVAADGAIDGRPVVIGHSMGGFVTILTAALHGESLDGVIVCDSPVTRPDPEVESFHLKQAFGRPRTYASVEEAMERFRTVPPQEHYLDYVVDHVARRSSARSTAGGSGSSTGGSSSSSPGRCAAWPRPTSSGCAAASPCCGPSTASSRRTSAPPCTRASAGPRPSIELPEAGHHAMLDEPLVLLTAMRTLLADWDHSLPHRALRTP